MRSELPDTLVRYFAAQNAHDAERMTACFALDATVRDEGRTYIGRGAIRDWKLETIAKYGISVAPLNSTADGHRVTVVAKVTGDFPGSPADLSYEFVLDDEGLIRDLEIH